MASKLHRRRLRHINCKKKGETITFIKNSSHVYCDDRFGNRKRIMSLSWNKKEILTSNDLRVIYSTN